MAEMVSGPSLPSPSPNQVFSAPKSTDATTAAGAISGNTPNQIATTTKISTLQALKNTAPELYEQMMRSIGTKMCNQMKDHQDKLKQIMREGQQR